MPLAPARLKPVRVSRMARSRSSQPFSNAADQHRVFARHLIGEGGHAEAFLHPPHQIQIGHAGLDHHHVGALVEVQRHFAQGLVAIGRIHLVAALVAGLETSALHFCRTHRSRNGP